MMNIGNGESDIAQNSRITLGEALPEIYGLPTRNKRLKRNGPTKSATRTTNGITFYLPYIQKSMHLMPPNLTTLAASSTPTYAL